MHFTPPRGYLTRIFI